MVSGAASFRLARLNEGIELSVGLVLCLARGSSTLWDSVDVIHHYTLRAALASRGSLPLDCARFLDHAAALVLLQKPGGGYLFVHRLLLEHFAKLGSGPGSVSTLEAAGHATHQEVVAPM